MCRFTAVYTLVVLVWYFTAGEVTREETARRDSKLKPLVAVHNMILCLGSLVMAVGTGWEVYKRTVAEASIEWFFCEAEATRATGPLFFWSYVYYLSKYYELIDTGLQVRLASGIPRLLVETSSSPMLLD